MALEERADIIDKIRVQTRWIVSWVCPYCQTLHTDEKLYADLKVGECRECGNTSLIVAYEEPEDA